MELRAWPIAVALALGIFAAPIRLAGPLLYDDKAAILRNPVVVGSIPVSRVCRRYLLATGLLQVDRQRDPP